MKALLLLTLLTVGANAEEKSLEKSEPTPFLPAAELKHKYRAPEIDSRIEASKKEPTSIKRSIFSLLAGVSKHSLTDSAKVLSHKKSYSRQVSAFLVVPIKWRIDFSAEGSREFQSEQQFIFPSFRHKADPAILLSEQAAYLGYRIKSKGKPWLTSLRVGWGEISPHQGLTSIGMGTMSGPIFSPQWIGKVGRYSIVVFNIFVGQLRDIKYDGKLDAKNSHWGLKFTYLRTKWRKLKLAWFVSGERFHQDRRGVDFRYSRVSMGLGVGF